MEESLSNSVDSFRLKRYQNAIANIKNEEWNVNGRKNYFRDLSAKSQFVLDQVNKLETSENGDSSTMKETLIANIKQQRILSRMMEAFDSQRFACIAKYLGKVFYENYVT